MAVAMALMETVVEDEEEQYERLVEVFKYKRVANKVRPVETMLPEEYRIQRQKHPDPFATIPELLHTPPEFVGGKRYTRERYEANDVDPTGFIWDGEKKIVHHFLQIHEDAFAWDETEKGSFKKPYFSPVKIPVIEHIPWTQKNIPIATGIRPQVISYVKAKVDSAIYEPSNSPYRSNWFPVPKKDGTIRMVHNLQPLNGVTIRDSAVPPFTDQTAEDFGGRGCYGMLDLYVAFDQRELDISSRDMTTFSTPLGTFRLTAIPMGWTNSFQVMHGDVTFMLQDLIPDVTSPYADDIPVKGPKTRYETGSGGYEMLADNPGV